METFNIEREAMKSVGITAALVYGVIGKMNRDRKEPTRKEVKNAIGILSAKQIRVSLKRLEESGLITSTQPNMSAGDVSKHYAVR